MSSATRRGLTLYAMTAKGYGVLRAITDEYPDVLDAVVGARDGSLATDHYDEIRDHCRASGIPFRDRAEAGPPGSAWALAVSWRWLIEPGASQLIVLHDSLLPRYRGFAPLVTALLNGDRRVGVTAILAEGEYDRGPIIGQAERAIEYPARIGDVIETMTGAYQELATSIVSRIAGGAPLESEPQDESRASYSLWRDEEDYRVDWTRSAVVIRRFVDAVGAPYAGASSLVDGRLVRILEAQEEGDVRIEDRSPGKVVFVRDGQPVVVCGQGLLRITSLVDDTTGEPLLPLSRFRTRFT